MISTFDLIEEYKNDTVWDNFFQARINATNFGPSKMKKIEDFFLSELKEVEEGKISWVNTFVKFKKLVIFAEYYKGYISMYKTIYNAKKIDKNIFEAVDKFGDTFWNSLSDNQVVASKLRSLYNITKNQQKKTIINDWLKNFFEAFKHGHKKNQYNKCYAKLQQSIEHFTEHNESVLTNKRNSIHVPQAKAYLIDGLDKVVIDNAKKCASEHKLRGWLFFISDLNISNLCSTAKNRDFRKLAYHKYQTTQFSGEHITKSNAVIKKLMTDKHSIAKIFGKSNYADLVISNYILNTQNKVLKYFDEMEHTHFDGYQPIKEKMDALARKDGIRKIKAWDFPYYQSQLEHELKKGAIKFEEHFTFIDCFPKIIEFFERKFQLKFDLIKFDRTNFETYHFLVTDKVSNNRLHLLISPFAKKDRNACYQFDLLMKTNLDGVNTPAVQYIELDINRKKMSFAELTYLIHEFGHAFHAFFTGDADTYSKNLNLSWDLIEMPSQFLESLVYDYNFMKKISKNKNYSRKLHQEIIALEKYFEPYYNYRNVIKNRIIFNTYVKFKPYSQTNIHKDVCTQMEEVGIIHNISQDNFMSYDNHLSDYGPTGYIYMFSEAISREIEHDELRNVYENIFNSQKRTDSKAHFDKHFFIKA